MPYRNTTLLHNPENHKFCLHLREDLKSRMERIIEKKWHEVSGCIFGSAFARIAVQSSK
jgi:hypothetical protein